MPTPLQRAYRFCLGDGSLTIAVFILIVFVFVLYSMVEVGVIRRFWLDLTFAAFLAMGAVFVFEPRPIVRLFLIILGAPSWPACSSIFLKARGFPHFARC